MSRQEFGGGVSESLLDSLQRKFGPGETKKAQWRDPMAGHNMRYCEGCPCTTCRFTAVCLEGCDNYTRWLRWGGYKMRTYRPPEQHLRKAER